MTNHAYILKFIQEGERILLYAYGKNGKLIYQYLKEQPQIQVIGIVDRNAGSLPDIGVPVYRPDQLKTIPADSYDKIVITVTRQKMGLEIYQIIRDSGVAEEKIAAPYTYLEPASALSVEDILRDPAGLQRELETFIVHPNNNLEAYFEPLIQELKSRTREKDRLLPQFREITCGLTPLENIVFLYILFLAEVFDAELMKTLMECLLKIEQKELRQFLYGIFSETSFMCFFYPEYLFPEFYNMRRTLLRCICEMYDFHIKSEKVPKRTDGKIHRICILPHILYDHTSSTTLLSLQLSDMLANMGYEVMVMPLDVCGYMALENPVFCPVVYTQYRHSREFEKYHKKVCHPKTAIEYTDENDLEKRMQIELDKLMEFSPDLIIDMSNELSILSYIYSQHFTTLYLPVRGYQSSSYFTYFAAISYQAFEETNRVYHSVENRQAVEWPFRVSPPKPEHVYNRAEYSLLDDDFVMVTVGSRLNSEMSQEFIDIVCKRMLEQSKLKWLIVGSKSEYLSNTYQRCLDEHKVIYIPYEYDLPALYKICDVYLNPKRQGGGCSFCWAMYHIPLAMVRMLCDEADTVGLENMIDGTYEQVMDYVLEMQKNPEFHAAEQSKFLQRALYYEERQTNFLKGVIDLIESRMRSREGET